MKTFLVRTTTTEAWELCGGSYLIIAESVELAKENFKLSNGEIEIVSIDELDLSKSRQIEIQKSWVEGNF